MSAKRKTLLQSMDALVWWTNASDNVRHDMSDDANERRHLPTRWMPLLPMTFGVGLIYSATATPLPYWVFGVAGSIMAVGAAIAVNGPLGKPSIDDDEREAALRKNAFFFCVAFLAFANIIGGPILLLTAALHGWASERAIGAAFAVFIGNMTWFVSLPTLYASWMLPKGPLDESS
jgi:hypothetical protein